jgi:hypothetical protein
VSREHPKRRQQDALRLLLPHWLSAPAPAHCPLEHAALQTDA